MAHAIWQKGYPSGLSPASAGSCGKDSSWSVSKGLTKRQTQVARPWQADPDRTYLYGNVEGGLRVLSGYFASTTQPASCSATHCFCLNGRGRSWRAKSCQGQELKSWCDPLTVLEGRSGSGRHPVYSKAAKRRNVSCRSTKRGQDSPVTPSPAPWGEIQKEGLGKNVTPESLWEELRPTINYLSEQQRHTVRDSLELAYRAHDGQKRKSGEPYIIHPVEVARILGELEMDWETVAAGLLHDTVEDTTLVTFEQIEELYGPVVRRIVEGETKVSKLGKMQCHEPDKPVRDVKADDLRQMFLAMTEEVRVIIVKLADRLHNMRTLTHMPPHKQSYIAKETLQVFAPLARLLGMYRIKSELEDLSFMYAHPEEYAQVKRRVDELCKEQEDVVLEAKRVLVEMIDKDKFLDLTTMEAKVLTLCKEPYSIHKKMLESGCLIDEVRDIAQLRIVLKLQPGTTAGELCNVQQVCYHVLGLIHAKWPPVPGTVKDYIATPKPNGYQSLHTTVLPLGSKMLFPLEIQIRTEEMDRLAEWGIAAHHSGREVVAPGDGHGGVNQDEGHFHQDAGNGYAGGNGAALEGMAGAMNGAASNGEASANKKTASGSNGAWLGHGSAETAANGATATGGRPQPSRGWSNCFNDEDLARRGSWLNAIREWQEEFVGNMTSREFVDTITGELLGSRVFVFTPKGEVKNLPKGATVVDYAYHIHTDVGNKMVAAKVNGNVVSPTHALANADVVEILTYDSASTTKGYQLHQQWLQAAKTRSARHKLTKFLREQAALRSAEITADKIQDFLSDGAELSDMADSADSSDSESGADSQDRSISWTDAGSGVESLRRSRAGSAQETLRWVEGAEPDLARKDATASGSSSPASFADGRRLGPAEEAQRDGAAGALWGAFDRANGQASEAGAGARGRARARGSSGSTADGEGQTSVRERVGDAAGLGASLDADSFQKKPNGKHSQAAGAASMAMSWDPGAAGDGGDNGGGGDGEGRDALGERFSVWFARPEDPQVRKALAGFSRWQLQMVSMWQQGKPQGSEEKMVQWLSVNCIDRTGMLAEVSGILTGAGVLICTHAGQTDRRMGVGVMLFEVEGFREEELSLICRKLEQVEGVLSFALGCTLQQPLPS